jgi:hypothetical protein
MTTDDRPDEPDSGQVSRSEGRPAVPLAIPFQLQAADDQAGRPLRS